MDKTQATFLVVTLISTATFAMDGSSGHGSMMDMKAMDTEKSGMLSKEEYMKGHEGMSDRETQWTGMKKNASDMVDMDEMEKMHNGKMSDMSSGGGGAMKDDSPMMHDNKIKPTTGASTSTLRPQDSPMMNDNTNKP